MEATSLGFELFTKMRPKLDRTANTYMHGLNNSFASCKLVAHQQMEATPIF